MLSPNATMGLGSSRSVLVVEDGVVSQRTVQVRELSDGRLEILQGVSSNAILVVGPSMRKVSDGSRSLFQNIPMWIADLCIRRPVLAIMMTAALMMLGVVSMGRISIDLFPSVEVPIVTA